MRTFKDCINISVLNLMRKENWVKMYTQNKVHSLGHRSIRGGNSCSSETSWEGKIMRRGCSGSFPLKGLDLSGDVYCRVIEVGRIG